MMTRNQFAALLGFAFVAAWIGFNFGYAVLCLVGAGVFYFAAPFFEGGVDLGELQARLSPNNTRTSPQQPAPAGRRVR